MYNPSYCVVTQHLRAWLYYKSLKKLRNSSSSTGGGRQQADISSLLLAFCVQSQRLRNSRQSRNSSRSTGGGHRQDDIIVNRLLACCVQSQQLPNTSRSTGGGHWQAHGGLYGATMHICFLCLQDIYCTTISSVYVTKIFTAPPFLLSMSPRYLLHNHTACLCLQDMWNTASTIWFCASWVY